MFKAGVFSALLPRFLKSRFGKTGEKERVRDFLFISWILNPYLMQTPDFRHSKCACNYFKQLKKLVNDVQHK